MLCSLRRNRCETKKPAFCDKQKAGHASDKIQDTDTEEGHEEDFTHEPLELDKNTIRILRILPGPPGSVINCQLWHIKLGDDTHSCLSYTWGSEEIRNVILINGRRFKVRHNLHAFLTQARLNRLESLLWIDAICIDQNNVKERNHQVQQMADIYRKAACVYIWPGLLTRSQKRVFCRLSSVVPFSGPTIFAWIALASCLWNAPSIREIRDLPYWQRAWIVQEILLAKQPLLVVGDQILDWHRFTSAICDLRKSRRLFPHLSPLGRLALVSRRQHCRQLIRRLHAEAGIEYEADDRWPTFIDMLVLRTQCSDIRDRIYGILGVIPADYHLAVDYDEEPCSLLLRVAQEFGGETFESLISLLLTTCRMLERHFRFSCMDCVPKCAEETDQELAYRSELEENDSSSSTQVLLVICDTQYNQPAPFHVCYYCDASWDDKRQWSVLLRTQNAILLELKEVSSRTDPTWFS